MKRCGRPKAIVTDRLRSYGAAMKVIGRVASTCSLRDLDCWLYWSDPVSLTILGGPLSSSLAGNRTRSHRKDTAFDICS